MVTVITFVRNNLVKFLIVLVIWTLIYLFILNYGQKVEDVPQDEYDETEETVDNNNYTDIDTEYIKAIESEHPSIPFRFWYSHRNQTLQLSKDCAKFPSIIRLKYHNTYWQTFAEGTHIIQLYNAYYDNRISLKTGPIVRILAMINRKSIRMHGKDIRRFYCQFWYEAALQPTTVKVSKFYMLWPKRIREGQLLPYLIQCRVPTKPTKGKKSLRIPKVVSLVDNGNECRTATNALRIHHYNVPPDGYPQQKTQHKFAICVKGMENSQHDISTELAKWLELQFMLGASKIYIYQMGLHPNVSRVLDYYRQRGLVDIRHFTLATVIPSLANLQNFYFKSSLAIRQQMNVIIQHDCFYRNMHRYQYIATQDTDEVLMPLGKHKNWHDLMAVADVQRSTKCQNGYGSYCFLNVHFTNRSIAPLPAQDAVAESTQFLSWPKNLPEGTKFWNMLQEKPIEIDFKCFYNTSHIIIMGNYLMASMAARVCPSYHFGTITAQMQHYHENLVFKDSINVNNLRFTNESQRRLAAVQRKLLGDNITHQKELQKESKQNLV